MPSSRSRRPARIALALALSWSVSAWAVDQPSNYPGCATREVSVPWGGSVRVDLSACHAFGLGIVSQPPAHGSTSPGDSEPLDSYVYQHAGRSPAGGGSDRFVVLDDASDRITVQVTIQANEATNAITAAPAQLPSLFAGTALDLPLEARGGSAPYRFQLASGALPRGLRLGEDGRLSGTPTERGPYRFGLRVRDARGSAAQASYSGVVAPAPMRLVSAAAGAEPGQTFSQTLRVVGGLAPFRFRLEPGAGLPAGISLSPEGVLSGTSSAAPGDYPVTLRITDSSSGVGENFELESFRFRLGPPVASILVHPASVAEDSGQPLVFRVALDAPRRQDTVVNLTPADVRGAPARVTIPAEATGVRIIVMPRADRETEPDETVAFAITAGEGYRVGAPARAAGTLRDDDRP